MLGFYAHAGFLGGLNALGIRPEALSGSSAGALVGGLYAAGVTVEEMCDIFVSRRFHRVFQEFGAVQRSLGMLFNRPGHTGMLRGLRAMTLLRERVGERRIEDCSVSRLAIAVTNLTAGQAQVVSEGPLADFILASGAFPGLFAARTIEGALYWDGGIANALPFEAHLADPAIRTIIIHIIETPQEKAVRQSGRPLRISDAVNLSHQVIGEEMLRLKSELARQAGKRLVIQRTAAPRPGFLNARRIGPECLACGRRTAQENAATLQELAA